MQIINIKLLGIAIAVVAVVGISAAVAWQGQPTQTNNVQTAGSIDSSTESSGFDSFSPLTENQQGVQPSDGARAPIRFMKQTIKDPASGNIDAIVYLIPEGWQSEGSVQWMPEWVRIAYLQTRIVDPSTGIIIDTLPIQDFIWFQPLAGFEAPIGGNYQGKMYVPPVTDPTQFVADFWMPNVLSHLQGASLTNIQQVPAVAEEFKRQFGGPGDANAYKLRYEYDLNGQVWQEDVSFALLYSGSSDLTSWYVNYAYTNRAPKGELDRNQGIISAIVASRTSTPEFEANYRLVQQLFNQGLQQQMADTVAFGNLLASHRAESQALQAQVTSERLASQDRIAEIRRDVLGGVDTYADPFNGGLVQLPVGWNKYWVSQQGEYIASDQPGFDPNTLNMGSWQQLQLHRS